MGGSRRTCAGLACPLHVYCMRRRRRMTSSYLARESAINATRWAMPDGLIWHGHFISRTQPHPGILYDAGRRPKWASLEWPSRAIRMFTLYLHVQCAYPRAQGHAGERHSLEKAPRGLFDFEKVKERPVKKPPQGHAGGRHSLEKPSSKSKSARSASPTLHHRRTTRYPLWSESA